MKKLKLNLGDDVLSRDELKTVNGGYGNNTCYGGTVDCHTSGDCLVKSNCLTCLHDPYGRGTCW